MPAELFGALVIGTYLLVGKQMAKAAEKPDLALWARTLQRLIREGSVPRDDAPHQQAQRPAQAPRQKSPRDQVSRDSAPSAESLRRKAPGKKKVRSKTAVIRRAR